MLIDIDAADPRPVYRQIADEVRRCVSIGVLNGMISEYTDSSRRRRAINCVYCDPKSRTRMVWWDTNALLSHKE